MEWNDSEWNRMKSGERVRDNLKTISYVGFAQSPWPEIENEPSRVAERNAWRYQEEEMEWEKE